MEKVFNSDIKPTKKLIMLSLADNSNDSGVCFPTISNIVKKTSLSRQSVNDNLKALAEDGLLLKKNRNRKDGSRTSNKYLLFPAENFSILDEEDMISFQESYTQSQRDVLPSTDEPKSERCTIQSQRDVLPSTDEPKSERCTIQSQRGVLPTPTQSQRGVHLEPSLNTLTITINHHLKEMDENENSLFNEYLDLRKSLKLRTTDSIKMRLLKKYFEFGRNPQIIENAISANWKDFYQVKQQNQQQPYNTPKSQTLNTDVNIWDEIEKQGNSDQELIDG